MGNISCAGMRAQNNSSPLWRSTALIFGLPGSIVTLLAVREGCMRAYGVNMGFTGEPRKEDQR